VTITNRLQSIKSGFKKPRAVSFPVRPSAPFSSALIPSCLARPHHRGRHVSGNVHRHCDRATAEQFHDRPQMNALCEQQTCTRRVAVPFLAPFLGQKTHEPLSIFGTPSSRSRSTSELNLRFTSLPNREIFCSSPPQLSPRYWIINRAHVNRIGTARFITWQRANSKRRRISPVAGCRA
jgi:hypothetical protein